MKSSDPVSGESPDPRTVSFDGAEAGAPAASGEIDLGDPRFAIVGEFARGGMSVVYVASDTWLGRRVAIKACRKHDPGAWMRLLREASVLSRLDHPWILPVYHSGTMPSGAPYLATRLVDGDTLEERLRREPQSWRDLLRHVVDVADAMTYAHARGVVHRDLKPGNVLIDRQGHTVVIDWGLAREISSAEGDGSPRHSAQITLPGAAVGTPGYWAPEQRAGDVVDPRSDIYSMGAMLFRMVAGRAGHPVLPMGAELARELAAAPPALRALVARATCIDPEERHPTMAALADDLRALVPRRFEKRRRRWWMAPAAGAALATVVAVVVTVAMPDRRAAAARALLERDGGVTAWQTNFKQAMLRVRDGQVRGVYDFEDGVLAGTLRGDVLSLRWCEAPHASAHDTGTAELELQADARGFQGFFRYADGSDASGPWLMRPAPRGSATAELERRLAAWTWRCKDPP